MTGRGAGGHRVSRRTAARTLAAEDTKQRVRICEPARQLMLRWLSKMAEHLPDNMAPCTALAENDDWICR